MCLLILNSKNLNSNNISSNLLFSISLISLVLFHYQSFILILSYFIYDLIYKIKINSNLDFSFYKLLKEIFLKYILVFIFTFPIYLWIHLRNFSSYSWNAGVNNEFILTNVTSLKSVFDFFLNNSIIVFSRMLSFTSEDNIDKFYIGEIIFLLFLSGIFLQFLLKNKMIKKVSFFISIYFIITYTFIYFGNLALSPTRHSAIFIPFIALIINNNFVYIKEKFSFVNLNFYLSLFIITFFLLNFYTFNNEYISQKEKRNDMFVEKDFYELLSLHNIDKIILYDWTFNTTLMKSINDEYIHEYLFKFIPLLHDKNNNKIIDKYKLDNLDLSDSNSIIFISNVFKLPHNIDNINYNKRILPNKNYLEYLKEVNLFLKQKLINWELIYFEEKTNMVEIEYSRLTENTSNNYFYYIYKRR